MYKRILSGTLLAVMMMIIAGCGGPADRADGTGDPDRPRIALIMKSLANEFFLTMEEGAREHQAAHADQYVLIAEGIQDELDVNRQIQLVEQMIARQVDAIVLAPADSMALVNVCQRAMDAGIVVVNIDNKLDDDVLEERGIRIPFVGPDNRDGAYQAASYLAGYLEPGDPVAIIGGVPSAFNAIQRRLGFEDAMNEAGMEIVATQSADWEMSRANRVVSALITEHPNLKAILCANDSMALGAVSALRSAGKLDDVHVIGFDNISAAQELLRNGDLLASVDQHADRLAVFGIEYALEMLESDIPPDDQETPVDLITAETLD